METEINDPASTLLRNVGIVMAGASDITRQASDILFLNGTINGIRGFGTLSNNWIAN